MRISRRFSLNSLRFVLHSQSISVCKQLDLKEPYDLDPYASPFFPIAEDLVAKAKLAGESGDEKSAMELYM